jgi:hypothetical protein
MPEGAAQVYTQSQLALCAGQAAAANEVQRIGSELYPDSALLHDAVFMQAANGASKPGSTLPVSGDATLVVDAGQLAAHGDWLALQRLDARLAAIPWTSIWHRRASLARLQWRSNAVALDTAGSRADTLLLSDALSVVEPTPELYLLRARERAKAEDTAGLLESCASYANLLLLNSRALALAGSDSYKKQLAELQTLIERRLNGDSGNRTRADEVRARLMQVERRLSPDTALGK